MTTKNQTTEAGAAAAALSIATHPFERAGLGKAPFRFVGLDRKTYQACPGAPIQPGAACDYCGTGIIEVCWIRSADGRVFKVGNECVRKTGDQRLVKAARKVANEKKKERDAERVARAKVEFHARPERFQGPHPNKHLAAQGLTLVDYLDWIFERGGMTAKLKAARLIESALKEEGR